MGHDVTVLTVRSSPDQPHVEDRCGYTVVRYNPTVTLLGNSISTNLAQYLADAQKFDVIHAHSHVYFATNLAALKRRLGDIPLAITNHGLYSQSAPEWVFDLYLQTLGRWTFNQADVLFCYTDVDKQRVRDLGVNSRIEVVPNGIDTERFTPEGPESDLIDADGPVVLFVGRLVEGKRPRMAIEAFSEVLTEYPNAEFYLCGDGPLQGELEAQVAKLEIGDSVTFLGHVNYNEMPKVYRSGDVLVLPSRAEGIPRTVLEAMATGAHVVCSDLSQLRELNMKSVSLVEIRDGSKTAQEIIDSLEVTDLKTTITKSYNWQNTIDQTSSIFEDLIA
jgi:glycosyltransferase involved in cell wall biosynthesis